MAGNHWATQLETAESNAWGGFLLNIGANYLSRLIAALNSYSYERLLYNHFQVYLYAFHYYIIY